MALVEFEEHCRKHTESSNFGYDEDFNELSGVIENLDEDKDLLHRV